MGAQMVHLRLPDEMLTAIDGARGETTRTAWLLDAADLALAAAGPAAGGPARPALAEGSGTLAGGIPCPGVPCSHPGCWFRDTARYGDSDDFGGLILCPAHAADATGRKHKRPVTPALRGAVRGPAA